MTPRESSVVAQIASTQGLLDALTSKLDSYAISQAEIQASFGARFRQGDDRFAEVMSMLTKNQARLILTNSAKVL